MLCGYLCRRGQPTVEFIFAATEEAVFVHVIISAKSVKLFVIHVPSYGLVLHIETNCTFLCTKECPHTFKWRC